MWWTASSRLRAARRADQAAGLPDSKQLEFPAPPQSVCPSERRVRRGPRMGSLILAIRFLTTPRCPVARRRAVGAGPSRGWFPVVGLLLGIGGDRSGARWDALFPPWSRRRSSSRVEGGTGGIHSTASPTVWMASRAHDPERRLAIMRDSRIGVSAPPALSCSASDSSRHSRALAAPSASASSSGPGDRGWRPCSRRLAGARNAGAGLAPHSRGPLARSGAGPRGRVRVLAAWLLGIGGVVVAAAAWSLALRGPRSWRGVSRAHR